MSVTEVEIVIFDEVLDRIPRARLPLVESGLRHLKLGQAFYQAQKAHGFYPDPKIVSDAEILKASRSDSAVLSPYTLVEQGQDGPIHAVSYIDRPPFKRYLKEIAGGVCDYINVAREIGLNPRDLAIIEASLRPQADAIKEGDFRRAMTSRLLTQQYTQPDLFFGLLDRYLDERFNAKFAYQGWLVFGDREKTERVTKMVEMALRRTNGRGSHRVLVGNAVAMAGLATERIWQGNTIPSEDDLRTIGSISYVFWNTFEQKFEEVRRPALEYYFPRVGQSPRWEDRYKNAAYLNLVMHEAVGHSSIDFDERAADYLKGYYVTLKELMAEVFGQEAVLGMPTSVIDTATKKAIIENSLASFRTYIEGYLKQKDPAKKAVAKAYAQAGAIMINYYQRNGVLEVSENGQMNIEDLDEFANKARQFAYVLRDLTHLERTMSGGVERFVKFHIASPNDFFSKPGNNDGELNSRQVLTA
ncbi:hypothetical protein HYS93_00070 [Candidatus Daviesbacteria bacterium]|nr:hypothetical protein [Candidatus Daviesbacteria bacterium]